MDFPELLSFFEKFSVIPTLAIVPLPHDFSLVVKPRWDLQSQPMIFLDGQRLKLWNFVTVWCAVFLWRIGSSGHHAAITNRWESLSVDFVKKWSAYHETPPKRSLRVINSYAFYRDRFHGCLLMNHGRESYPSIWCLISTSARLRKSIMPYMACDNLYSLSVIHAKTIAYLFITETSRWNHFLDGILEAVVFPKHDKFNRLMHGHGLYLCIIQTLRNATRLYIYTTCNWYPMERLLSPG